MRGAFIFLAVVVAEFISVGAGAGQEIDAPYPGATVLEADSEFQLFQALEVAAAAGVPAKVAQAGFSLSTFTTDSAAGDVADHLAVGAVETFNAEVANADSVVPGFLATLEEDRLGNLARAVGSDLTGPIYRDSLLTRLSDTSSENVEYHFIAHEHPDGSLTYYEVHRPFLNVGSLRWIDGTRIRVIRLYPAGRTP